MMPLDGILVVANEQAVAAPFCTARLADAGARVIKIERPEGDFARGYDKAAKGESSYFVWLNRGKESVVLDLTDEAALVAALWIAGVVGEPFQGGAAALCWIILAIGAPGILCVFLQRWRDVQWLARDQGCVRAARLCPAVEHRGGAAAADGHARGFLAGCAIAPSSRTRRRRAPGRSR
jgi:hypothetical protein